MYAKLILVLISLVLHGCASTGYQSDPTHSTAWNYSKAADVRVPEIPHDKVKDHVYTDPDGNLVLRAAGSSAIADYALLMSRGFLTLTDIGITFGAFLIFDMMQPSDPATLDHIVSWMPTSMSQDDDEAAVRVYMRKMVERLQKVDSPYLSNVDWNKTYSHISTLEERSFTDYYELYLFFSGGYCDKFDCALHIRLMDPEVGAKPDFIDSTEKMFYIFKPVDRNIPDMFVYCAYPNEFTNSGKALVTDSIGFDECKRDMEELNIEFYSDLPIWVASYKAPKKDGTGHPLPMLQHKGKILLYIEPEET